MKNARPIQDHCPSIDQLERFVVGSLEADVSSEIESHLSGCGSCASRVVDVRDNLDVIEAVCDEYARGSGPTSAEPLPSDAFPGYELDGEVHHGAQGVVYRAHAVRTGETVAVKVLRDGPFATPRDIARFEREALILGQLEHPGIVTVHETGRAADHDYFVMQFIDGESLAAALRRHGTQPVRETLHLFLAIADAVAAAHRRGVIHRDLKPSNIVLDRDGAPHVLDFGLAKMAPDGRQHEATAMTRTGHFLGSLPWASPEQAEARPELIDVRTDVYALGVLLFQMLTGRFPYPVDGNIRDVIDAILRTPPAHPRSLRPAVPADVDTIVMTALAKDPLRRYQSAGEFARDVKRFLDGDPIEARRDHLPAQLLGIARRHRVATLTSVAIVVLIISFGIWMSVLYTRATAAEERARAESEAARRVAGFLTTLLGEADPTVSLGHEVTARAILDEGAVRIDTELTGDRAVKAALQEVMGSAYANLGAYDDAEPLLRAAFSARQSLYGDDDPRTADSMIALARLLAMRGTLGEAETLSRAALAIRRRASMPLDEARALDLLAHILLEQRRYGEVETAIDEAQARLEGRAGNEDDTLRVLYSRATLWSRQGRGAECESLLRTALEQQRIRYGDGDHPAVLATLGLLADAVRDGGSLDDAVALYSDALAMAERIYGPDHPRVASVLAGLTDALPLTGRLDEADRHAERLIDIRRAIHGEHHAAVASALSASGWVRYRRGAYRGARERFDAALSIESQVLGAHDPAVGRTLTGLGAVSCDQGEYEDGRRYFERALEIAEHAYGPDHGKTATACANLTVPLFELGAYDEIVELLQRTLAILRALNGDDHASLADPMTKLATALHDRGDFDEAEHLYRTSLDIRERHSGADHPLNAFTHLGLGQLLVDVDRADEARVHLERARALRHSSFAGDHWLQACSEGALGACLAAQGHHDEAETMLLASHEAVAAIRGTDNRTARRIRAALIRLYDAQGRSLDTDHWRNVDE